MRSRYKSDEKEFYYNKSAFFNQKTYSENSSQPMTTQYVYHKKNKNFIGTWVLPLNKMPTMDNFESTYKITYESEKLKYEGRQWQMDITIPALNDCLWNDVVFMSPLHPNYIYSEFKILGLPVEDFESYEFFQDSCSQNKSTSYNCMELARYQSRFLWPRSAVY